MGLGRVMVWAGYILKKVGWAVCMFGLRMGSGLCNLGLVVLLKTRTNIVNVKTVGTNSVNSEILSQGLKL